MEVISNNNLKCTIALAALCDVVDPEIGLNVVDLGLIYQIDFDEDDMRVDASMTLTTRFCPMGESITQNVQHMLERTFPGYATHINLTFDPPWRPERISPEGQAFLNR